MDKLDEMISRVLDEEDRAILDKIGRDQSYPGQIIDLFRGRSGWWNWVLMFVTTLWFVVGLYAAWKCFSVTDVVDVVRWGLLATFLMLSAVVAKVGLLPSLQANRILQALKHMEMQIALLAAKR